MPIVESVSQRWLVDLTTAEQKTVVRALARRYSELACWRLCTPETEGRFDTHGGLEYRDRAGQIAEWATEADQLRGALHKITGREIPAAVRGAFIVSDIYSSRASTREKSRITKIIMEGATVRLSA